MLLAAAALSAAGCDEPAETVENRDPVSDRMGEVAEERAEARAEARGEGPLDEEVAEEVAEERAELATDVGADPTETLDEPAGTAAEGLAEDDIP
jgi:hypothetical protein